MTWRRESGRVSNEVWVVSSIVRTSEFQSQNTPERISCSLHQWRLATCAEGHKSDPATQEPLDSLELRPNVEMQKEIKEWRTQNLESQVDVIRPKLTSDKEEEVEVGLLDIFRLCEEGPSMRLWLNKQGLIPTVVDILKSSSRNLRRKCLATLCNIANHTDENRVGGMAGVGTDRIQGFSWKLQFQGVG